MNPVAQPEHILHYLIAVDSLALSVPLRLSLIAAPFLDLRVPKDAQDPPPHTPAKPIPH